MAETTTNGFSIFGFEFGKRSKAEGDNRVSFVAPERDDGAMIVAPTGGVMSTTYVDLESSARNENEIITKYRHMAMQPEIDMAVDEIVNEAVTVSDDDEPIKLVTDRLEEIGLKEKTRTLIAEEFKEVLRLLDFYENGYEIFRRWYVDGRIYYHAVVDEKSPIQGIKELRYVDPRKIRKVRELKQRKAVQGTTETLITSNDNEYFLYSERGFNYTVKNGYVPNSINALRIRKDSVIHLTSGLLDESGTVVISYLHKAMKPLNQLRVLEDACIIYRLTRAPERRVWYIDVGDLPKVKAEEYVQGLMNKHKNRLVYDAASGSIRDDRKFMTMIEDYWLPRREGGMGTKVEQLPGGQQLSQMDDIEYFKARLYKSLNIPVSRLDSEQTFSFNKGSEISRDEVKFAKFVTRLRSRFNGIFLEVLKLQLLYKQIITADDWDQIASRVKFDYAKDNYFAESRDAEVIMNRMNLITLMMEAGVLNKYYSHEWVQKKVLKQTDEEIKEQREKIEEEQNDPVLNPPPPEDESNKYSEDQPLFKDEQQ